MTIRIEITGETSADILENLGVLTRRLLGGAAPVEPAETAEPEAADEPKKSRGRPRKGAVIEHDPNEGKKNDVHSAAGATDELVGDAAAGGTGGVAEPPRGEADPDGEPAEDEAPAEVAAVAEKSEMTINDLRSFTINEYLNVVTDSLPTRKELYGALLAQFSIKAITELPVEKIGEFKAVVDAKIAEAMKA